MLITAPRNNNIYNSNSYNSIYNNSYLHFLNCSKKCFTFSSSTAPNNNSLPRFKRGILLSTALFCLVLSPKVRRGSVFFKLFYCICCPINSCILSNLKTFFLAKLHSFLWRRFFVILATTSEYSITPIPLSCVTTNFETFLKYITRKVANLRAFVSNSLYHIL